MSAKINIVGIGDDGLEGLTRHARTAIDAAEVLIGNRSMIDRLSSELTSGAELVIVGGVSTLTEKRYQVTGSAPRGVIARASRSPGGGRRRRG